MPKHPIQDIHIVDGVVRFRQNEIVNFLLNVAKLYNVDLNTIACTQFSQDDREQFAMLIGYSLSGFSELSYVSEETYLAASMMAENQKDGRDTAIQDLEIRCQALRNCLDTAYKMIDSATETLEQIKTFRDDED